MMVRKKKPMEDWEVELDEHYLAADDDEEEWEDDDDG